ncbi:MAG: 4-hydroxy-tetrahydrodipicolinate reductase [Chitinispirillaceae bacterium]|jgi:4-hydroxy-tetrahydrodipicolinate reductase|nr:4-hydroxy-tetrahydrodipicolinate reductase [Chitinispirillaceae bacterium]
MALPIIINGALGKMGAEIAAIVCADTSLRLVGAVDRRGHPRVGEDYGTCIGKGKLSVKVTDTIPAVTGSVIIDFSSPAATRIAIAAALAANSGLVIGTTGLADSDLLLAKQAAGQIPVLVSPNMSLGVNLLFHLTRLVSSRLKDTFDIEIIEAHHRFKKDSPSGTARRLGEIVAESFGLPYDKVVQNGRSGITEGDRPRTQVGMHAVRGGDIVGDHTVIFAGMGERIELRHSMQTRSVLAQGAVVAAKWLGTRKPGYYAMNDVLGIE